jgi:hypothetical protein
MGARIKTEQEFIREFGPKWTIHEAGVVDWLKPNMDYLFGKPVSRETAKFIKDTGKCKASEFWGRWTIYSNMIITTLGDQLDMDRLSTWPPVEGHAKWWSDLGSKQPVYLEDPR